MSGWRSTNLGNLGTLVRGISFPKEARGTEPKKGFIACLRTTNVQKEVDWDDLVFVPEQYLRDDEKLIRAGDILISNANSLELVGKSSYVAQVPVRATLGTFISAFRCDDSVDSKFVYFQLCAPDVRSAIRNVASTTTNISNVSGEKLGNVELRVPSLPEQRRIVAKIEELFTQVDAGVQALERAKVLLKQYRQSLLKSAFSGKLTEKWRQENRDKIEPASVLLERIREERKKKLGKKYKELPPLDTSDLPELPEGWAWVRLQDVASKVTDGEHFRPKTIDSGVLFLSAKDVTDSGIDLSDPLFMDPTDAVRSRLRCDPERGDILVVSRGAGIGRSCIVNIDKTFCLLGSVILIKPVDMVLNRLILLMLKSPFLNRRLTSLSGSTAQQAIYLRDITVLPLPLPPIEEQHQLVQTVDDLLSKVDYVEHSIEHLESLSHQGRQSVLNQAFSGALLQSEIS
ncbi:MAG: restriction endonuclease subunit S [Leptospirales bacterium]|nr:restriction endonuclease subunit S [Leptospirales bacterium]